MTDEKGLRSGVSSLWIGIENEDESKATLTEEGLRGVRNGVVVKNRDKWDGYLSRGNMWMNFYSAILGNVIGGMDLRKEKEVCKAR